MSGSLGVTIGVDDTSRPTHRHLLNGGPLS